MFETFGENNSLTKNNIICAGKIEEIMIKTWLQLDTVIIGQYENCLQSYLSASINRYGDN